jgi:hypothetical protein
VFGAYISGGGVSLVGSVSVGRVSAGICVISGVVDLCCRNEFSGMVGVRGKGRSRHGPVVCALQRFPFRPACGMSGRFRVSEASVSGNMEGRRVVVSICVSIVF